MDDVAEPGKYIESLQAENARLRADVDRILEREARIIAEKASILLQNIEAKILLGEAVKWIGVDPTYHESIQMNSVTAEIREFLSGSQEKQANAPAAKMTRQLVIHGLGEGRALCGLPGIPRDWPLDHQWVGWADTEKMNCPKCIEASKAAHKLWADRDKANHRSDEK